MPEDSTKLGVVVGCERLNVRENACLDAAIICELRNATEIMVDLSESTDDFYRVYTVAGIGGFCMKKFVSI